MPGYRCGSPGLLLSWETQCRKKSLESVMELKEETLVEVWGAGDVGIGMGLQLSGRAIGRKRKERRDKQGGSKW